MIKPVKIALACGKETKFLFPDEIIYCQSEGNYTVFYLTDHKKLMFTKSLKEVCSMLPQDHFIRIHHSFAINLSYAEKLIEKGNEHELVLSAGVSLPVSRRKKADFLARFSRL